MVTEVSLFLEGAVRSAMTAISEGETSSSISEGAVTPLPFDGWGSIPLGGQRGAEKLARNQCDVGMARRNGNSDRIFECLGGSLHIKSLDRGGVEKTFGVTSMLLLV